MAGEVVVTAHHQPALGNLLLEGGQCGERKARGTGTDFIDAPPDSQTLA